MRPSVMNSLRLPKPSRSCAITASRSGGRAPAGSVRLKRLPISSRNDAAASARVSSTRWRRRRRSSVTRSLVWSCSIAMICAALRSTASRVSVRRVLMASCARAVPATEHSSVSASPR